MFAQNTGKSKCETEAVGKKGDKIDILELARKLLVKAKEAGGFLRSLTDDVFSFKKNQLWHKMHMLLTLTTSLFASGVDILLPIDHRCAADFKDVDHPLCSFFLFLVHIAGFISKWMASRLSSPQMKTFLMMLWPWTLDPRLKLVCPICLCFTPAGIRCMTERFSTFGA